MTAPAQATPTHPPRVAIISPTYRNDYELAVDLCRSVDAFFEGECEHILIVPQHDLKLFSSLQGPRRKVVTQQSVLKRQGFTHLPIPTRIRIPPFIDMKLRQQWWCKGLGRVSGWVAQQLIKLSASDLTDAELLIFMDSDIVLVKPLSVDRLLTDGRINLLQVPMRSDLTEHQAWYRLARQLLALPDSTPPRYNYIGQLVTWDRANLIKLHAHIAKAFNEPWQRVVSRRNNLAEYILYGVFCDEVLGPANGHAAQPSDLTHSVWTSATELSVAGVCEGLHDRHVALHIQSTLRLPIERRRALLKSVIDEHRLRAA